MCLLQMREISLKGPKTHSGVIIYVTLQVSKTDTYLFHVKRQLVKQKYNDALLSYVYPMIGKKMLNGAF